MKDKEWKKIIAFAYTPSTSIVIVCKRCGCDFEETAGGYYAPLQFEEEKQNRECRKCLSELGVFS